MIAGAIFGMLCGFLTCEAARADRVDFVKSIGPMAEVVFVLLGLVLGAAGGYGITVLIRLEDARAAESDHT